LPPPTRCQILRLKCTKFNFGWGSAPDPAGGAYSAPRPLAGFKSLLLRGGRGEEKRGRKGWETEGGGKERGREWKGGERKGPGGGVSRNEEIKIWSR